MLANCVREILTQRGEYTPERSLRVIKTLEVRVPGYLVSLGLLTADSEGNKGTLAMHRQTFQRYLAFSDLENAEKIAYLYVRSFNSHT
jgi:hypothetical protein